MTSEKQEISFLAWRSFISWRKKHYAPYGEWDGWTSCAFCGLRLGVVNWHRHSVWVYPHKEQFSWAGAERVCGDDCKNRMIKELGYLSEKFIQGEGEE
jgi:hypothetical protein